MMPTCIHAYHISLIQYFTECINTSLKMVLCIDVNLTDCLDPKPIDVKHYLQLPIIDDCP
jgi:hypothetical protein